MKGMIIDTVMLNVRKEPKPVSELLLVLFENAEADVDLSFEDSRWYRIKTATGGLGYVPKGFIALKR